MKTLFCSPIPSEDPRLGASRVILDLAEAWRANGWKCDLYSARGKNISFADYPAHLAAYLKEHATDYDVVDFPYNCMPWIDQRHSRILKVARSVLLQEHCMFTPDPAGNQSLKRCLASLIRFRRQRKQQAARQQANANQSINMDAANRVTVGNSQDKECLLRLGLRSSKIIVLPYGLTESHKLRLSQCGPSLPKSDPVIVFLGTFDYRKGCLDFSEIFRHVLQSFPAARLKLIGTKGMCQNRGSVYRFFPKTMHDRIAVIPTFEPEALPDLLNGCAAGLFPSYREGFGIGVVEMLAAGLPVVAYDAPGPCDILPEEWLAPRGNSRDLAEKLLTLLNHTISPALIERARSTADHFLWRKIALETHRAYTKALNAKGA